ncbi:MAG: hypothetical protein AAFP24_08820 [Pseudomonadota bacterium]
MSKDTINRGPAAVPREAVPEGFDGLFGINILIPLNLFTASTHEAPQSVAASEKSMNGLLTVVCLIEPERSFWGML